MSEPTPTDHDMLRYESVRTWIEATRASSLRPGADTEKKLALIAAYSAAVGSDPDSIVTASCGDAKVKNRYLKQLVDWAADLPGSERTRHDAENAIRGFFMRNGFRVVARPYRDVYQRPAGGPS